MTIARLFRAFECWHLRVLGTFWTLSGLFCPGYLVWQSYWWDEKLPWIPVVLSLPFIIVGVGFARGRIWAVGFIIPLLIVPGLFCADIFLAAASAGNDSLYWQSLAGLSVVAYTGTFALLSFCKFCWNYV